MQKGLLPSLSQILALEECGQQQVEPAVSPSRAPGTSRMGADSQARQNWAEVQWSHAIAALNTLLHQENQDGSLAVAEDAADLTRGMVLSSPAPVLSCPELVAHFSDWIFTLDPLSQLDCLPFHLLPSDAKQAVQVTSRTVRLPVLPNDPIATERFCLVLTPDFSLVLVLGEHPVTRQPAFQFSFEPETVSRVWRLLRSRLLITSPQHVRQMEALVNQFAPVAPDYRLVMQFSRWMLAHPPAIAPFGTQEPFTEVSGATGTAPIANEPKGRSQSPVSAQNGQSVLEVAVNSAHDGHAPCQSSFDAELLRAIAHEIRTPLTTIRTLTRLLLKRQELDAKVLQRLNLIDRECTQQIDRFNLIFRAVELQTAEAKRSVGSLSAMSLDQIFQESIPRWQQQANQRNIHLEVLLPKTLPSVVSDPIMLNQVLTGLIERFTHSLPIGSDLELGVMLAGHQLKLQFKPKLSESEGQPDPSSPLFPQGMTMNPHQAFKSLGQLLMVQPETGNLSLNLSATKNLFQALGGKLVVKQRPQQGEVLTVFLPLDLQRSSR